MSQEDDWRGRGGRKGNRRFDSGHRRGDKYRFRGGRSGSKGERGQSSSDGSFRYPPRPPGLRGKEIGLWYRDRGREMKKDKGPIKAEPTHIDLDQECMNEIWETLDRVKARPPEYLVRKYRATRLMSPKFQEDDKKGGAFSGDIPVDKYSYLEESKFKRSFINIITGSIEENLNKSLSVRSGLSQDPALDEQLIRELREKHSSKHYQEMVEFRKKLPAFSKKEEILDVVNNNQVVVISGETGCGKTTQVAQFILDHEIMKGAGSKCHIMCTQPRRISAISVAERVADERDESIGNFGSVGYQIRLEKMLPRNKGSILFCTTGILLQFMQSNPGLLHVSHVIIDEIHERDTLSDFTITILKDVLAKRSDLKLILMSATLNAERFSMYYNNCPMLCIPGFTFPVQEFYLEDVLEIVRYKPKDSKKKRKKTKNSEKVYEEFIEPYVRNLRYNKKYSPTTLDALLDPDIEEINIDLIYSLIYHICYEKKVPGAILVFLPGWDKISALFKSLNESGSFPSNKFLILPLHSMMPTGSQKAIFDRPPPGIRKIVIATNIAETSITIDDIVFVIDCGKVKMKQFDIKNNISTLNPEWVSLANAKQRRGRAGRVQAGICYHLFSKAREMALDSYPLPEMLRTRLEEVILQAKILQLGNVKSFLKKVLDPPDPVAIDLSLKMLVMMNALDEDETLTPLGYHIAQLPLDPTAAKMILMGSLFSCVDPIFSIAASLSFKDAFYIPLGKEREVDKKKDEFDMGRKSDHLIFAEVISQWEAAENSGWGISFCHRNFLSRNILFLLKDMKKQFSENLYSMQFLNSKDHKNRESNRNSNNIGLIRAVICSGLLPNVAFITRVKRLRNLTKSIIFLRTHEDGKVGVHPKSVNARMFDFESRFLLYHLKLKSTKIYIHDSTMVHPLPLIFFGHSINKCSDKGKTIFELSDVVRFSMSPEVGNLITELKIRLDWLLEQKISNPGVTDWSENSDEGCILRAISKLITREDRMLMEDDGDDFGDDDDDYDDDDDDGRF